jgi:UDP-N-acetylmuramyl pentapeptide phosphotransferase/UDP-N-acetylglucosamine-1-phosphate transferase
MAPGLWVYGLVLIVATGVTVLLTPVAIRLGVRWGMVAVPGGRRKHKGRVPVPGGLAIFPAFVCAALLPVALGVHRIDALELTRLTGILLGMGIVWIMGFLDDRYRFHFLPQFLGLAAAAVVAILFQVFIELFNNPFTDAQVKVQWYLMVPITLVWIIGMTGTVNVLDGLDGLATGVTAIAALVLFIHMLRLGQYSVSLLPLALLGCCLGFLVFNFSPARIFLGGGAYLLGYGLATISIVSGAKVASALLVLWPPILDVLWQGYARWRRGQSLGLGDRGHLHFRLADMGWPQTRIVILYYAITALLGAVALLSPTRILKLVVLSIAGVLLLVLFIMLTRDPEPPNEAGR